MTGFLASVRDVGEARTALAAGADVIDLKEPGAGALGAVADPAVRAVMRHVAGRRPVSATIGDRPMQPGPVCDAVAGRAALGVDYVKIGMFAEGDAHATLAALESIAQATRLVAVLFADQGVDLALVARAARHGFAGVMLDTADKAAGGLRSHASEAELREFVAMTHACGMFGGLAGALQADDVPALLALEPDYLGFRGALCDQARRTAALDMAACRRIRACIPRMGARSPLAAAG